MRDQVKAWQAARQHGVYSHLPGIDLVELWVVLIDEQYASAHASYRASNSLIGVPVDEVVFSTTDWAPMVTSNRGRTNLDPLSHEQVQVSNGVMWMRSTW